MFDRRLLTNFDWSVLIAALLLTTCGICLIYSATYNAELSVKNIYLRQIYWSFIALAGFIIVICMDYHQIARYGPILYLFNIALLAYLLVRGDSRAGVQRWITFRGISFQPSEFTKVAFILIASGYLARRCKEDIKSREIALLLFLVGLPLLLIAKQPDLGTALLLVPIFMVTLLVAEVPSKWLIYLSGTGFIATPIIWRHLKSYQINRILSFIRPDLDPLGIGYQVLQSRIAVGAGGISGQGFLAGTQSQLRFIPQHHTDFIFSVLAEEWGFIGSVIVLGLFLFIILKGIDIALHARDRLGTIIAMGIVTALAFHVITNVGMVIGIMPITGIPLPFLSYGGTSLVTNMAAIGMLLNIRMRRFS